jgi:hypothetical protein
MATPKTQIRAMFATPVAIHFLPVAAETNSVLRPLITERLKGASATEAGFESWGGPDSETLFRMVREVADSMTATRGGARVDIPWKLEASASLTLSGETHASAAQPGAVWSGVYLVDDGYQKSDDEMLGGEYELADPRGILPAMVAPDLGFRLPGGLTAGGVEVIRPATGMILLYPSWLARGMRRFNGKTARVVVGFDLKLPA